MFCSKTMQEVLGVGCKINRCPDFFGSLKFFRLISRRVSARGVNKGHRAASLAPAALISRPPPRAPRPPPPCPLPRRRPLRRAFAESEPSAPTRPPTVRRSAVFHSPLLIFVKIFRLTPAAPLFMYACSLSSALSLAGETPRPKHARGRLQGERRGRRRWCRVVALLAISIYE
ncbi:hypothetical protein EVAR_72848_1 [Eumeta japonica]|uniref:Uncharacterized protein n=1 Tax=Eumeta variegata TaxID=151549 RepID=A0A4C1SHU9_EUMVA|nr:hypothetical protein EVAR_72848_1 [Eumeta japonica]